MPNLLFFWWKLCSLNFPWTWKWKWNWIEEFRHFIHFNWKITFKNRKISCCSYECRSDIQALKQNNRFICNLPRLQFYQRTNASLLPHPLPLIKRFLRSADDFIGCINFVIDEIINSPQEALHCTSSMWSAFSHSQHVFPCWEFPGWSKKRFEMHSSSSQKTNIRVSTDMQSTNYTTMPLVRPSSCHTSQFKHQHVF